VRQYLDFFAAAYYIPAGRRTDLIADILKLTDLEFKRDAPVQALSRGMQQRLGVARVLIHDPKILILDEPASGLDPRARVELRELLRELATMGKTILISSHILSELSEVCNRVGIVEQGTLVFEGTREALFERLAGRTAIVVEPIPEHAARTLEALRSAPFAESVESDNNLLRVRLAEGFTDIAEVAAFLSDRGCRFRRFGPEALSLEQAFMALTEGKLA
jgi:ABC-2 type transport system ATP-binding protein